MLFNSKQTINGSPVWAVDTDTQTVIHVDTRTGETKRYMFHADQIKYYLNHLSENYPDRLQKLVDSGEIYHHLDELDIKVTDAVNRQQELFEESSRDFQVARETGDIQKQAAIANMLRMEARRIVFETMVYV